MGKDKVYKDQFYRIRMCPSLFSGSCARGDTCCFAHSARQLRVSIPLRKTKLCEKWERGECEFEKDPEQCKFAHGNADLRHTATHYKTAICQGWRNGSCTLGELCRYAHGSADLRQREPLLESSSDESKSGGDDAAQESTATERCESDPAPADPVPLISLFPLPHPPRVTHGKVAPGLSQSEGTLVRSRYSKLKPSDQVREISRGGTREFSQEGGSRRKKGKGNVRQKDAKRSLTYSATRESLIDSERSKSGRGEGEGEKDNMYTPIVHRSASPTSKSGRPQHQREWTGRGRVAGHCGGARRGCCDHSISTSVSLTSARLADTPPPDEVERQESNWSSDFTSWEDSTTATPCTSCTSSQCIATEFSPGNACIGERQYMHAVSELRGSLISTSEPEECQISLCNRSSVMTENTLMMKRRDTTEVIILQQPNTSITSPMLAKIYAFVTPAPFYEPPVTGSLTPEIPIIPAFPLGDPPSVLASPPAHLIEKFERFKGVDALAVLEAYED